jgi:hypothetical protein
MAMYPLVATKDPVAVEAEVQAAYLAMFPEGDKLFVPQAFGWAIECFSGRCQSYQRIDARYHDLEHTLQGTLCMARLLHGRHDAGAEPVLGEELAQLGLVAILFHDTGYLKRKGDMTGTGAKYTVVHVARSAEFAGEFLKARGYGAADIRSVQNMIQCTGVNAPLDRIPFQSESERMAGYALGTADLLGQMAAEDYIEKLPVLYAEFAEAARHEKGNPGMVGMFSSAEDLIRKTPGFWENYVQPKLNHDFAGMYRFLNRPYPAGPNAYVQRIEASMERLRGQLAEGKATVAARA